MCTVHAKGPFMNYVFNKGVILVQTNANPGEGVSTTFKGCQQSNQIRAVPYDFSKSYNFQKLKIFKKNPCQYFTMQHFGRSAPYVAATMMPSLQRKRAFFLCSPHRERKVALLGFFSSAKQKGKH